MFSYTVDHVEGKTCLKRTVGDSVQERNMSPRYRIADPHALQEKLSRDFECTAHLAMGRGKARNWIAGLLVKAPNEICGYRPTVGIMLPHTGRASVKLKRGVLRLFCQNQFTNGVDVKLHHCDQDIMDRFTSDPGYFVQPLLNSAPELVRRIEGLREIKCGAEFLNALSIAKPRLGAAVLDRLHEYTPHGELSLWSVIQALTDPGKPGLQEIADRCLGADWETFKAGFVPACVTN